MASRARIALLSGLTASFVLVSSALLTTACGDDEEPPADAPDAADEDPPPPPPSTNDASNPNGTPIIQVDCPSGTTVEQEPNETPSTSNEVSLSDMAFCGSISPGADADYSKFSTPSGKKLTLFQAVIDGKVDFELVVNGKTFKPSEVKKWESGNYVVKAFTTDKQPGKYRYRIQFEP